MDSQKLPGNLQLTLEQIATRIGGKLEGPADLFISRLTSIETADSDGITFAEKPSFVELVKGKVAALLLPEDLDSLGIPCIRVSNPRLSFLSLLKTVHRPWRLNPGISNQAAIDIESQISDRAEVGAFAVVEKGAIIESGAKIYPFAYIGENCYVGENSIVGPHAVLVESVVIGKNCIIQPGAILGGDGFGYFWDGTKHQKIPQVGRIEVGDFVEIGALSAVDRATSGATSIGNGSKLDNFVQIAHNCIIGEDVVIASHVGIAGTSEIGDRCVFGGQSGVGDHVKVASDVTIAGRGGVPSDIPVSGQYYGMPAQPIGAAMRSVVLYQKLPELAQRLRETESRLKDLELLVMAITEESGGEIVG